MKKYCLLYLLCMMMAHACKKSPAGSGLVSRPEPVISGKGIPEGPPVRKIIGSAGGSLVNADGSVTITVPAGAVAANTEFGIQPISNTLGDSTVLNYRLTPEGTTFPKPVRVAFRYDQPGLSGMAENGIYLAYQTATGAWKAVPSALNKQAKTVSVATTHFSDWSIVGSLNLVPGKKELVAMEETHFKIEGMMPIGEADDLLAPLSKIDLDGWVHNIRNWRLIAGNGLLSDITNEPLVKVFRAPETISTTQVAEVQVELTGNMWAPDSTAPGGRRTIGQVILLNSVTVLGGNYMTGSLVEAINTDQVFALYSGGKIHITGHMPWGYVGFELNGSSARAYACGDRNLPGTCFGVVVRDKDPLYGYASQYTRCDPPRDIVYSEGTLNLKKWGGVGEPVEGEFTGKMYSDHCDDFKEKTLKLKFRTIRAM
ncbi:hypothetical protein [Chitinophaga sp. YIM B06452]|uniref:hypothetical protein n=1 Tax=Chitinophaga sp. YIM B06452 TaxID=3082158 RepID=UPI0031FE512C